MGNPRKPRLLIFVVAYQAESTLAAVIRRIPVVLFEEFDCEVLVVDDASKDRTFQIGQECRAQHPGMPLTVLRNTYNQGYGGNQKVGYAYAIAGGFDFVALLHGDGQYAPEELPRLLAPLREGRADAVFGSRMLTRFGALRGGMPLYKYAGNKLLTAMQNRLLGTRLSEFHSGYRVYSVHELQSIPYRLNSNDFHFDTEIIIQLLNAKRRIVEVPISTSYGDEICRVNGLKYAKDVFFATLRNVLHRAGLSYERRYDPYVKPRPHRDRKFRHPSGHSWALDAIPAGARVLDFGGASRSLGRDLARKGCEVIVVDELSDDPPRFDPRSCDHLLMLDVVERLRDPEAFLDRLRKQFDYQPRKLVLTTPNVAFFALRLMLLFGRFDYRSGGTLDRRHARLFTFRSLGHLLRDAGFRIERVRGVPVSFADVLGNGVLGGAATAVNLALIRVSKTLFAYRIFVEAVSTPGVDFVLEDAKRQGAAASPDRNAAPRSRTAT